MFFFFWLTKENLLIDNSNDSHMKKKIYFSQNLKNICPENL